VGASAPGFQPKKKEKSIKKREAKDAEQGRRRQKGEGAVTWVSGRDPGIEKGDVFAAPAPIEQNPKYKGLEDRSKTRKGKSTV